MAIIEKNVLKVPWAPEGIRVMLFVSSIIHKKTAKNH